MNLKTLALMTCLGFGIGCSDTCNKKFDVNVYVNPERSKEFYEERISEISGVEIDLNTELITDSDTLNFSGRGFIVGDYVFSLNHVTSKYSSQTKIPFLGFISNNYRRVHEETKLDGIVLHSVVEDSLTDLAIFDLKKSPKLHKKYSNNFDLDKLVLKEDLYAGMKVFWNGNPEGRSNYYREAIISKTNEEMNEGTIFENSFILDEAIIPGTSGTPIWHFDGTKNKIVGVAQYMMNFNGCIFGGVKPMDGYFEKIREYENESGK